MSPLRGLKNSFRFCTQRWAKVLRGYAAGFPVEGNEITAQVAKDREKHMAEGHGIDWFRLITDYGLLVSDK